MGPKGGIKGALKRRERVGDISGMELFDRATCDDGGIRRDGINTNRRDGGINYENFQLSQTARPTRHLMEGKEEEEWKGLEGDRRPGGWADGSFDSWEGKCTWTEEVSVSGLTDLLVGWMDPITISLRYLFYFVYLGAVPDNLGNRSHVWGISPL